MMSDTMLRDSVQTELGWEPRLDAGNIGVTAKAGVVTLTGNVPTYSDKCTAETAARRVKGVKAVAEELEVRLPFSVKRDDRDIAAAIVNRFAWDDVTPAFHPAATRDRLVLSRMSAGEATGGVNPARCFSRPAANAAGVA